MLGSLGLLVASCAKSPAPTSSERIDVPAPSPATPDATASADRPAPSKQEDRPVPEAVAKLHDSAFEPTAAQAKLGPVICVVTLHDAATRQGSFHPVVLFEGGAIATWRQTTAGPEEAFFAELRAGERRRAFELVEAISDGRALARETFNASAQVMGVSTREGERVETLYFDDDEIPAALSGLVALLKQRLEATNRPR